MVHPELRRLAEEQDDVVAAWQLAALGWTAAAIRHRAHGRRRLHDGVFLMGHARPTQRQRWRAACLTAPGSFLSHLSGGTLWTFHRWRGTLETITRAGDGGPRRAGALLIMRSRTLAGQTTLHDGLPVTTAARTVWDLAPRLDDRELRKCLREAIRLNVTTATEVRRTVDQHPNRRGSHRLSAVADVYLRLPLVRCRSDAEAMALEVLDGARVPVPHVNERFAGEEADLCWPALRLIIEIDGPAFHRLKDGDARKTAAWRAAGYDVRRIPSGDVFDHPGRLLALAPRRA